MFFVLAVATACLVAIDNYALATYFGLVTIHVSQGVWSHDQFMQWLKHRKD